MKFEDKILFASVPKLTQLKYFFVVINFDNEKYAKPLSDFNRQKIVARCLIESSIDILAAPFEEKFSHIHLITSEEYCRQTNFKVTLDNLQLTLTGPYKLHHVVYLDCIRFTLTFKLSPEWNRIQNYFFKSENFFNICETTEIVQLHLLITDDCLCVGLRALRLKLPILSLVDMGIDFKAFYQMGFAEVRKKVYTLPDLKPGTAVNVYSKLPDSCPFKDYSDLREYWQVLYGYNLPENEEGMIYIEVTFGWNSFAYVYPIICVCPYEPFRFKSKNSLISINEFLESLKSKFSRICGHTLQIKIKEENIFRPVSKLHVASEMNNHPNLLNNLEVVENSENNSNSQTIITSNQTKNVSNSFSLPLPIAQTAIPRTLNEKFKCCSTFVPSKNNNFLIDKSKSLKKLKTTDSGIDNRKKQFNLEGTCLDLNDKSLNMRTYREVESYAHLKNLKRFTVSVLINFCKENNIPVKSKERKDSLMQKIYDFFAIY